MNGGKKTFIGSAILLTLLTLFMIIMAFTVRHTNFVQNHPFKFFVETIILSIFTAAPVFIIIWSRKIRNKAIVKDFFLLFIKVFVFWILSEFSGLTDYLFRNHAK